ncbi:phosphate/phosphite/phosphonate ABC transporter substrate-binding protein [Pontibacterium sp.]|uniref:phosphate/phosphite/phosphonate ABC transporter substrate-binding protein n=1 Tax=Pontibacterium sp. TaxID=2036026 RepID=UPI0035125A63
MNFSRKIYPVALSGALALASMPAFAETLSFGIVPQQSAKKLAKLWTPIFKHLSEKTGTTIRFATANNIPTFEKRVRSGEYDIAYMNPYHYTVFSQKPGYDAIARQKNKRIKGIVVVKKDSEIKSLEELDKQKLAFPSPAAFAASVLPRAKMEQDGMQIEPKYVSSHDSVYLSVSKGFFVAGGGVMRTFNNTSPDVRENLRVLWTTPTYTPHAIAVHPRVKPETVEKLKQALLEMNTDPEGQRLLKTINFKGIELAQNADWDDVRGLNIRLLDHLIAQ